MHSQLYSLISKRLLTHSATADCCNAVRKPVLQVIFSDGLNPSSTIALSLWTTTGTHPLPTLHVLEYHRPALYLHPSSSSLSTVPLTSSKMDPFVCFYLLMTSRCSQILSIQRTRLILIDGNGRYNTHSTCSQNGALEIYYHFTQPNQRAYTSPNKKPNQYHRY